MAFQVGRVGRTITVPEPEVWSQQDGTITVSGKVGPISPNTDAVRLRDQLLGYFNNWDEPIVPVVMDSDPRLTGYYRLTSVSVPTDQNSLSVGALRYSLTLEPVLGFAQPIFESILTSGLLTNVVGAIITDEQPFHGVPHVVTEYGRVNSWVSPAFQRSSSDGTLDLYFGNQLDFNSTAHFYLTPSNFYVGACTIEQGSALQPVVGRALQPDVVNWRLSNGLVRVTPNATPGKLDVAHWKGAAWATAKTYKITGTVTRGLINGFSAVTVLRNTVEECTLRLSCTSAGGISSPIFLDISLHRGDRLARCYLATPAGFVDKWSVFRDSTEASTAVTYNAVTLGGIRATANDGDGNRYVLLSYQAAVTNDLTNGGLTQNATQSSMDIGIGSEIGGSGAVAHDQATDLANQYVTAQGEAQRIVAR